MQDRLFKQNRELTALMKSYDEYFSAAWQKHLMSAIHEQQLAENHQEVISAAVEHDLNEWYDKKLVDLIPGLDNSEIMPQTDMSVREWLDILQDENDLVLLAIHAAVILDDTMPRLILEKLYNAGADMRMVLLDICLNTDWSWQDDSTENIDEQKNRNQQVCCSLLKVLGQWQSAETMESLLDYFVSYERPDDRIAEAVGLYLINMGPEAVKPVSDRVTELIKIDPERQLVHEYLMMALASIGQTVKSDMIFSVLRDSLRKMANPLIAAACIGDYGDPRGIRVLRSWLENKLPSVAPALYQEMASAIKRLGGDLDGLVHPMFPQAARVLPVEFH
ncbi:MAG: hypothetical protein PWP10_3145 [Clostridiales bacterium]|jgi:hypothetical protein|nr:hypothetical protein [Clostridiales bacterium]